MIRELITQLIFIGVISVCIGWQIGQTIMYIRRLRKTKEHYENQLKELRNKPPKIIKETVPLSVIDARQYVPAEQYLRTPTDYIEKSIEQLLEVQIGEKIVEACGVRKCYDAQTDTYCFRVAVEVTGRSFK